MSRTPRIFVGSSTKAKDRAGIFCTVLGESAEMLPWWLAPEFDEGFGTIDAILDAASWYDYGLFIFTPDDRIESEGETRASARDNVLFEYGLFLGVLGPKRTFAFVEKSTPAIKVPSDLSGVTLPRFSSGDPTTLRASINVAAERVRAAIRTERLRQPDLGLVHKWGFDGPSSVYEVRIPHDRLAKHERYLRGRSLLLVVRKEDETVDSDYDTNISLSETRRFAHRNIRLRAEVVDPEVGRFYEAHLFSVPPDLDRSHISKMQDIAEACGERLETVWATRQA